MKIYIANLAKNASCTAFWDLYSNIGIVREVEIIRSADKENGRDFVIIDLNAFPEKLAKINAAAHAMQQLAKNQTASQAF